MDKQPAVGDVVIYHDPVGSAHNALVTAVWSTPIINLVVVSQDEQKRDDYGRQIERYTSVAHREQMTTHGFYWRWPDETANPYVPPLAT